MRLPEFSIEHWVTVVMIALISALFGLGSFFSLNIDLMPDIEQPVLTIVTEYSGMSAEDVEEIITKPIEQVVSAVKGIKNVTSTSTTGKSTVFAEFEWGSDLDAKTEDIRDMIERIKKFLPPDVGNPLVLKINLSQMPILLYGVCGMKNSNELRRYLNDNIVPRIERIDGVSYVVTVGGFPREIRVLLDRNKMLHYKINSQQIVGALNYGNMNVAAGYIESGNKEYLVRTVGFFRDVRSIENTVVGVSNKALIRIRDIGRVEDGYEEGRGLLRVNGKDAVLLAVSRREGANTVNTVSKIRKTLDELSSDLPSGIEFNPIIDQGRLIHDSFRNMMKKLIWGFILASIFIFLMLRDWRPTIAVLIAIPFSILTSFIGLKLSGYTLNVIALAGLLLIAGRLVNDSIVVIENVLRHICEGKDRREAAKQGASEAIRAIGTSSLATIAAFLLIGLGGGIATQLMGPFVLTICIAVLTSFLIAVTIVPVLASSFFRNRSSVEKRVGWIRSTYEKALSWSLSYREAVILITVAAFIAGTFALQRLGAEFIPSSDYGMAILKIRMPSGTALAETERLVSAIERHICSYKESKYVMTSIGPPYSPFGTGGSNPFFPSDVNEATIMIRLKDKGERRLTSDEIVAGIRKAFPSLRGVSFEFVDISGNSGGVSPVEIKIFGKDLDTLKRKAEKGAELIKGISGLKDIKVSMRGAKPEIQIIPDRDRASSMGLTTGEVGNDMRLSNLGQIATRYRDRGDDFNVRVLLDKKYRGGIDDIRLIPIVSRFGGASPVANIADIRYGEEPETITREKRIRKVTVTANIQGGDLNSIGKEVRARLDGLDLPEGYFLEYGGAYKKMYESGWYLFMGLIAAVLLVYIIIAALFESFSQPLAVMSSLPAGLLGAAAGLGLLGLKFSSPAFMGLIIGIGILVANGIIIVDYVNRSRKKGLPIQEAIVRGASNGLRTILINTLTTVIALTPIIFSAGEGSEMIRPLAVTVAGGLIFSTLFAIFVVPAVYSMVTGENLREKRQQNY